MKLKKDDTVIFENKDDMINVEAIDDKGDVLTMTFNNTEETVKAYLNGVDQIDLTQKIAAFGIWYDNHQRELKGKADNYTLSKDGKIIF